MVSSFVEVPLSAGVPATAMPCFVAEGKSRCLVVRPVWDMSFRLGNRLYSLSLK